MVAGDALDPDTALRSDDWSLPDAMADSANSLHNYLSDNFAEIQASAAEQQLPAESSVAANEGSGGSGSGGADVGNPGQAGESSPTAPDIPTMDAGSGFGGGALPGSDPHGFDGRTAADNPYVVSSSLASAPTSTELYGRLHYQPLLVGTGSGAPPAANHLAFASPAAAPAVNANSQPPGIGIPIGIAALSPLLPLLGRGLRKKLDGRS
jgi:hypothetical protein